MEFCEIISNISDYLRDKYQDKLNANNLLKFQNKFQIVLLWTLSFDCVRHFLLAASILINYYSLSIGLPPMATTVFLT